MSNPASLEQSVDDIALAVFTVVGIRPAQIIASKSRCFVSNADDFAQALDFAHKKQVSGGEYLHFQATVPYAGRRHHLFFALQRSAQADFISKYNRKYEIPSGFH